MGKYDPLGDHLRSLHEDHWVARFSEIDHILGFALPRSARVHSAWWGNERSGTHSHARAWMEAGWLVHEVSLGQGRITFGRVPSGRPAGVSSPHKRMLATRADPFHYGKADLPPRTERLEDNVAAGTTALVAIGLGWSKVGPVRLDMYGELAFPSLREEPGLYRFRFTRDGMAHAYVGETNRLRRRLHHYRNPGPSQQTNIRMNILLKKVIQDDIIVEVDVLQSPLATTNVCSRSEPPDLSIKSDRLILERVALDELRQNNIVVLNSHAGSVAGR